MAEDNLADRVKILFFCKGKLLLAPSAGEGVDYKIGHSGSGRLSLHHGGKEYEYRS